MIPVCLPLYKSTISDADHISITLFGSVDNFQAQLYLGVHLLQMRMSPSSQRPLLTACIDFSDHFELH